ncbi:hypothetical protein [Mucisphaera calidilacus]|uniref:hypothetical protein n=1 Tax=Mucisphaera calidilacus TaxID=2527982 RepID=UPI001F249317|nr:hypothetical protein [Mucisphaera calidilacus]
MPDGSSVSRGYRGRRSISGLEQGCQSLDPAAQIAATQPQRKINGADGRRFVRACG